MRTERGGKEMLCPQSSKGISIPISLELTQPPNVITRLPWIKGKELNGRNGALLNAPKQQKCGESRTKSRILKSGLEQSQLIEFLN